MKDNKTEFMLIENGSLYMPVSKTARIDGLLSEGEGGGVAFYTKGIEDTDADHSPDVMVSFDSYDGEEYALSMRVDFLAVPEAAKVVGLIFAQIQKDDSKAGFVAWCRKNFGELPPDETAVTPLPAMMREAGVAVGGPGRSFT